MEVIKIEKSISTSKKNAVYLSFDEEVDRLAESHRFINNSKYDLKYDDCIFYIDCYSTNKNNEEFIKLLNDIKNKKIINIYAKSFKNLIHNKEKKYEYINYIKKKRIEIFYEEELKIELEEETSLSNLSFEESYIDGLDSISYGIYYNPIVNEIIIDKSKLEIVKYIYNQYLNNAKIDNIKNKLNRRHIPIDNYTYWRGFFIVKILTDIKYTKDVTISKKVIVINSTETGNFKYKPIISKSDFLKARNRIDEDSKELSGPLWKHNEYCFTGRIRCGFCGGTVTKMNLINGSAYKCLRQIRYKNNICLNRKAMKIEFIEKIFLEIINKLKKREFCVENEKAIRSLKYITEYIKDRSFESFNPEDYSYLIYLAIIGTNEEDVVAPYSLKFILKENMFSTDKPTKEAVSKKYYELFKYETKIIKIKNNSFTYRTDIGPTNVSVCINIEDN